jgi:hypothetical protein
MHDITQRLEDYARIVTSPLKELLTEAVNEIRDLRGHEFKAYVAQGNNCAVFYVADQDDADRKARAFARRQGGAVL